MTSNNHSAEVPRVNNTHGGVDECIKRMGVETDLLLQVFQNSHKQLIDHWGIYGGSETTKSPRQQRKNTERYRNAVC
jgi:hypothetical protein